MRAAEQRWPADWKAEAITSLTICSGRAEESAIIAFWPPVSAISVAMGRVACGQRAIDRPGGVGAAGEGDTGNAGVFRQRRTDRGAVTRQVLQHVDRYAGGVQQLHGQMANQGGLFGRLGDHRVAAASAALTWPRKIASGKFHGLMQTNTPRPCRNS
jgi:hypothetical protein